MCEAASTFGRSISNISSPLHSQSHSAKSHEDKMSGESPAPNGAGDNRDPSGFLSEIINRPVTVKLNSGVVYKGAFTVCFYPVRLIKV